MRFILSAAIVGITASLVSAQQPVPGKATDVQITGHIYEAAKMPASDENVAKLKLPPGFKIEKFAEGLIKPRIIAVANDGSIYVSRRESGDVLLLKDTNGDGKADFSKVVLNRPGAHGLIVRDDAVYVVTIKELYKAPRNSDGTLGDAVRLIDDLPDAGQHPNRTMVWGPDDMIYLSVGSTTNEAYENNPENATILRVSPDGKSRTIFAKGLRNTIGFQFHPVTKALYGMDHGIDWLGDDEQKEELNKIDQDKNYGWPFIYADGWMNAHQDPPADVTLEEWKRQSTDPLLLYRAHSAPMQWVYADKLKFPAEFKGDAFMTMRGSWNRKPPSGYEVVRIHFENNEPVKIEPFLTGFLQDKGNGEFGYFARPVGLAVAKDGSLLLGDDDNGIIYRISYSGTAAASVE